MQVSNLQQRNAFCQRLALLAQYCTLGNEGKVETKEK